MAFTEKGLAAIEIIRRDYSTTETFTAAKLGVAPAVLTSLTKDGYLIRQNTKPVSYVCDANCREKIDEDYPKSFAPYSAEEMAMQIKMTYQELVMYCINKYGRVSGTYFCTSEMKSVNSKIKRGGEGLYVHHIMEDRAIMLSNPNFAKEQPWEYQMPHNLVYCNIFEHLLLHTKIVFQHEPSKMEDPRILPGIGGIMNYIYPQLDEDYNNNGSSYTIENITYEQYIKYVNPLIEKIKLTPLYRSFRIEEENRKIDLLNLVMNFNNPTPVQQNLPKKQRIKRSDGYQYKTLLDASKSIGGGSTKAKKIEKAIRANKMYGGFYWEYIE